MESCEVLWSVIEFCRVLWSVTVMECYGVL